MPWAARAVSGAFPDAREGDTFLLNDPYHGGSHLPDLTILVPVLHGGALRFWSVVRAHQSDIGGATHGGYNPGATEIWQEGLRVPPIRLGEGGGLREDLLRMLAANTRIARDFRGDLMAMVGAARLGRERLRSEEHTSELQSRQYLVCRLLLEKKKKTIKSSHHQSASETKILSFSATDLI